MKIDIPIAPEHDHQASIPCQKPCPRWWHYVMNQPTCTERLRVTVATASAVAPAELAAYICGQPMPCSDHEDADGRRGVR